VIEFGVLLTIDIEEQLEYIIKLVCIIPNYLKKLYGYAGDKSLMKF
jgi:hypothetical protein